MFAWQPLDLTADRDEAVYLGDPGSLLDAGQLLADVLHRPAWHALAACRGTGTDVFFA